MSAMTQPATNTPPTNMAKQYRPYFNCSIVELRCVMPKTIEAKIAKTTAAVKCDRLIVTVSSPAQYDAHPQLR